MPLHCADFCSEFSTINEIPHLICVMRSVLYYSPMTLPAD
jgi:hypothetical protein